jgi:hypothetical protein
MSPCGATLFTLSVVRSYGDVATLTWQFASRFCFPDFVHFVFPMVPVAPSLSLSPTLETHPPFSVMSTWQHRRNFLLLTM